MNVYRGTGCFDEVTYQVKENDSLHLGSGLSDAYNLTINMKPAKPHFFGLGIRYDTEEGAALLLNVGLNEKKFNGSKLNLSAKLSYNPRINLRYTYSRSSFAKFNVSADYRNEHFRSRGVHNKYVNLHYQQMKANAYISEFHLLNISTKVGASFVHTTYDKTSFLSSAFDSIYYVNNDMVSPFITFQYDNLDDPYFANHGILSTIGSHYYYMTSTKQKYMDISYAFQAYITPYNGRFTIIPQLYGRYIASIDNKESSVQYYNLRNVCGGEIAGRHFENQMPFIGLTSVDDFSIDLSHNASILRCDLRYNFYGKHYLTAMYNASMPWGMLGTGGMNFTDIFHFVAQGAGLKYSFNSLLGPVSLTAHWFNCDDTNHFGAYFSFGYTF
jgi:NTE family protein